MGQITPALVIMAAGMGSRYGGLKQLDRFGPGGETIIEYSVYDAIRAGFGKVVFVIRQSLEAAFKEMLPPHLAEQIRVEWVCQELDALPAGFSTPAGRVKPWGTGHAVWVARPKIREPFAVINGDDFYGAEALRQIADFLTNTPNEYCLAGYQLANTLSEYGTVARGICEVTAEGYLSGVAERTNIGRKENAIIFTDESGHEVPLTGNETVSMNLMGFTPAIFDQLDQAFTEFLPQHETHSTAEFYLPVVVNRLVATGKAQMKVLPTTARWFGVTYAEDKPLVKQKIAQLVAAGSYPEKLWS